MKKVIIFMIVFILAVSLSFVGVGCKEAAEGTAAETAAETAAGTEVVAEKTYNVAYVDGLLGDWALLVGQGYKDYFADKPNFNAKALQVEKSSDVVEANEIVESVISEKVDGILMLVFTSEALLDTLAKARAAGIKYGTVGTTLAIPSFVPEAPDFVVGGVNYPPAKEIARKVITEKLNGKGNVVILNGGEGSNVADDRKKGFEEACAAFPDITVVYSDYAGWLDDTAYDVMSDLLVKYDKIDLVLGCTDLAAKGAYEAAKAVGREKESFYTGWDFYSWYSDLMKTEPQFYGSVAALPYFMGTLAAQILEHAVSNPEFMRLELFCEYPVITLENMDLYQVVH